MEDADRERRFEGLYRSTYSQVYAYCRRRTSTDQDAEDATEETFVVAWRRLDDCLEAEAPLAWLYAAARRVTSNQRRGGARFDRVVRQIGALPVEMSPSPEERLDHDVDVAQAFDALERLSPTDRELIRLATFEELSYAEIGHVLGLSVGNVRSRLFRARERLRNEFFGSDRPGGGV